LYYEHKEAFADLVKADMGVDFSWRVPATEYMQLYREL
jgi:glycogen synthase